MQDDTYTYDALTRNLIRLSTTIIGLLACLALGSLVIFWLQTRSIESTAGVVNVSGRQRMLSQRSALLAECLVREAAGPKAEDCRRQLVALADQMEAAHQGLVHGDRRLRLPASAPDEVLALYFGSEHSLDAQVQAYLAALRSLASTPQPSRRDTNFRKIRTTALEGSLLRSLDEVVSAFQALEERKVARLQRIQSIVFVLTLITIIVMQLRVVRPMGARVGSHLKELALREERLRRQGEQLRLTLEHAPVGIATCDLEGRMLSVNQALCHVLGHRDEQLIGRRYLEFSHRNEVEANEQVLRRIADGEVKVFSRQQRLVGSDEADVRGLLRGAVVNSAAGAPRMIILQFEDHSEQLRTEEALHLLQERLAHMNRLGTMGEMAAGIAHEMNQPLSAIAVYARACRRALENGSFRGDQLSSTLDKISQQAHRASEVIRRIRSLVERRDVQRHPSDLAETIQEAVALAETEARLLGQHIETELDSTPALNIDRVQIQQVLLNLMRNGLEAAADHGSTEPLVVACGVTADGGVEISVADRGAGVAAGHERDIFEPFFTSKDGGMGMGLSICRSIVEAHGGRLWWTPNAGGGAVFHLSLPRQGA